MIRFLWAPTSINDQNPLNAGALSRIEGWPDARPMSGLVRVNDHSLLSYITLKRVESWDTVRSHLTR